MDPVSAAVAVMLATFATEVGKGAWAGMQNLLSIVRHKFAGDRNSEIALQEARSHPEDEARVRALALRLHSHAEEDSAFRNQLATIVQEAKRDQNIGDIVSNVYNSGRIGKVVTLRDVEGDVNF